MATTATSSETKAVIVTGGSAGGIGHATAVAFAKLGYNVAITGRNKERLEEALSDMKKAAINQETQKFLSLEVDMAIETQVDSLIPKVIEKFGRLDILVNNAGFTSKNKGFLEEGFYEDFKIVMQVNLFAPTRLSQLAAPYLLDAPDGGVIINISSVVDRVPVRSLTYAISKAGLNMLTKTLANTFDGKNVRVLTVSPGPIETNFVAGYRGDGMGKLSTLAKRSGSAEEVANVILFLASNKASYMTGSTVDVDGGFLCKAGLLLADACRKGIQQ